MPKRTILSIIAITIPAVLVSAVLSCPFIWVFSYSKLFGEKEIFTVAQEIRGNETDSKIILNGIAEWLSKYMTYDTSSSYYYPTFPFRLSRQTHPDPAWVMTVKRGACEETSKPKADENKLSYFASLEGNNALPSNQRRDLRQRISGAQKSRNDLALHSTRQNHLQRRLGRVQRESSQEPRGDSRLAGSRLRLRL